jgi:hypothetical protein
VVALASVVLPAAGLSAVPAEAAPPHHFAPPAHGHVASSVPVRRAGPRIPYDNTLGNVDYNGGPVMASNTNYLIFWSPGGIHAFGSGSTPEYVSGLTQYFADLAHDSGRHSNTDSVSTQYNDLTHTFVSYSVKTGGMFLDTDKYPASHCPVNAPVTHCLTDNQVQQELEGFATAHHLKRDLVHEFFVFTPPHVEECFSNDPNASPSYGGCSVGEVPSNLASFCAYHSNSSLSPMVIYSIDTYVAGSAGCDDGNHPNGLSDGEIEGGLSHEHNESITDPIPNDAWTNGGVDQGLEVGDQCEGRMGTPLGTAPNGAVYNQLINGHFYWFQEEWSNQGHTCLQRYTRTGSEPVAKVKVTAASGLAITFDASGSTAPGGVAEYVWQFNDSFGAHVVQQSVPTITHTFPVAGAYSVGLTVYAADGLSIGTGGIVTTGQAEFSPGFTSSPANPPVGEAVSFSGLTAVSRQPVMTYFWDFGDGATGSGATPSHAYAAAGTYKVKLVLFSGIGSAFPGSGAGPIVTGRITVG